MWYLVCAISLRIVRSICVTVYLYAQLSIVGRLPNPNNWVIQFVAKLHNVLLCILIMRIVIVKAKNIMKTLIVAPEFNNI